MSNKAGVRVWRHLLHPLLVPILHCSLAERNSLKILSMRLMTGRGALGRISERLVARKYRFGMQKAKLPSGSASIPGIDVNIGVDLGEVTFTGERSMLQSAATARLGTLAKRNEVYSSLLMRCKPRIWMNCGHWPPVCNISFGSNVMSHSFLQVFLPR